MAEKAVPVTRNTCGSTAGYATHLRHKETACPPCKEAERLRAQAKRRAKPEAYKRYYAANRRKVIDRVLRSTEKHYEIRAKYREETAEHIKERNKKWRDANPEIMRDHSRRRRALRLGVRIIPFTEAQVLERYGTDCHLCGEPIDLTAPRIPGEEGWERGLHLDHDLPLILGGSDTIENVKPAHGKCNLKKRRKAA